MRRVLIAGNWKMNGSLVGNQSLLEEIGRGSSTIAEVDWVVLAPSIYLPQVQQLLNSSHCAWGGQDVSNQASGAFTGEISAKMFKEFGCRYVIVGHSERRTLHNESNELVAQKAKQALSVGLIPIVCVGETLQEREESRTMTVIEAQLQAVNSCLEENLAKVVLAYEPIWAIGTGRSASPFQAQEVHGAIRTWIRNHRGTLAEQIQILYGGSVKPNNAADLLQLTDVDGALVGGASLNAEEFLGIGRSVSHFLTKI